MEIPDVDKVGKDGVDSRPVQEWFGGVQRFDYWLKEMLERRLGEFSIGTINDLLSRPSLSILFCFMELIDYQALAILEASSAGRVLPSCLCCSPK